MGRTLLLIGAGGFIGSIARYLTSLYFTKLFPSSFPYGTFAVNIIGCLVLGLVVGLSERLNWLTADWRIFLTVGICGAYTTFSTFSYENIKLLQEGNFIVFAIYTIASFALCLLALLLGLSLSKI